MRNHGYHDGVRDSQSILGVAADGEWGPLTHSAYLIATNQIRSIVDDRLRRALFQPTRADEATRKRELAKAIELLFDHIRSELL